MPIYERRKTRQIHIGAIPIGGGAPISVQSMCNTKTTDTEATVQQIRELAAAGCDIVRLAVPDMEAAKNLGNIIRQVKTPLVADIHFDYRIALKVAEYGVDCLRINPGNIGREDRIRAVVDCAKDKNIPIRIGVNAGSLEKDIQEKYGEPTPQALLESALRHVEILDRLNFDQFKVSVKASDVYLAVESYRLLAKAIKQPLHLGITEAGGARAGAVKSAIGLGMLLAEGIGDTLRVSLAADPVEEIKVGFDILKSLRIRSRGINFIACPTCSRQEFDVIGTVNALEQRLEDIITPMDVSIIGCVVNGPGEALVSDLGVTGGNKKSGYYLDGERQKERFDNDDLINQLEKEVKSKKVDNTEEVYEILKRLMSEFLLSQDSKIYLKNNKINVILIVGVNGVGKTTTIGKLALKYKNLGKKVLLGAGDTFRAAAVEQLEEWAKRADVDIVKGREGADPASVVYDTLSRAEITKADVVIIDTAGRLHNKANLMRELEKINNIIKKKIGEKEFNSVTALTGFIVTKLDGTAKGGIVFSVSEELKKPIKFIGLGEKIGDLIEFNAKDFVEAIFN